MKQSLWWISDSFHFKGPFIIFTWNALFTRKSSSWSVYCSETFVLSKCKIGLFYSLFDPLNYCRRQSELYCCIHDKLCPETDPGYRCWPIHCRQPWVKAWLVSNSKTFIIKTKLSQYHCCFLWQFDNFFVNSMPWSMTLHRAGKAEKKYYDFM